MSINALFQEDLQSLYADLYDAKATFRGEEISVIYDSTYDVQSIREKVIRVQASKVVGISNSDTISIGDDIYRVISFLPTADGLEMIIGVEL